MTFRAVLTRLARLVGQGPANGYVDYFDSTRIAGWAFDPSDMSEPALLSLYVDGVPEMNIIADIPREDVRNAGLGPLKCGFDTTLPRRLRDGQAHRVELRLGSSGTIVRGGTLEIAAGEAAPVLASDSAEVAQSTVHEGVAFYDRHSGAISGWAMGCNSVTVQFDDGAPQTVLLDREVPGFGSGLRPGFRVFVPDALRDGLPHQAQVFFGRSADPLDGAPVSFALMPDRILVELTALEGNSLTLSFRHSTGALADIPVVLSADGQGIEGRSLPGGIQAELPDLVRTLVVSSAEGEVLARFAITDGQPERLMCRDLPPGALSPEMIQAATQAFTAFCEAPDDRFDPLWYRWSHPDARDLQSPDALIAHYRDHGAGQGIGPGPLFDEQMARSLYPALAEEIAQQNMPCAFALELALGRGSLQTLTGLDPALRDTLVRGQTDMSEPLEGPHLAHQPTSPPVVAQLPSPVQAQNPTASIYAAWLSRLDISENIRTDLTRADHLMRSEIASTALPHAPLVSVIMPSWNRAFTIGEAIQSVLEQSYPNWELIVCDDASDDRTSEVVRGFDDPRIRYMKFLKSNGAGARNKGLRQARGDYIAYLDSDNLWHPLFLDLMLRRLMANPGHPIAYSAYLDTVTEGAKVRLDGIPRPNFRPIRLSSKNFMDLNSIVHHRRVYDWMGGFDSTLPRLQDWDLALRYTSIFRPLFVNHVGVFYRRNVAWGQVTHLFMGSNAQATVGEKTRRRLEVAHERLHIAWPTRSRITILAGSHRQGHGLAPGHARMAESLARMAAQVADVDLVELGPNPDHLPLEGMDPPGLTRHQIPQDLQRDPGRLGTALGGLIRGRPVLSVGCSGGYLRAIEGLNPALVWRLRNTGEGSALQGLDVPLIRFELGALPLMLPQGTHASQDMTVLVLLPSQTSSAKRDALRKQLTAEAQRRGLTLLLPPADGNGWVRIDKAGETPLSLDPQTCLPEALGQVGMTVSLAHVSELEPFELALLNALQGRAVPAAVLPAEGRARATGFARQWIESRAAYEIQVNDSKWIFDKVRKLLGDETGLQRLQERSQTVHRIAYHPEQAQQRLAHALYRLLHDFPTREVIDDQN